MKKICIFGSGGSARETYWIAKRCGYEVEYFLDIVPTTKTYDGVKIVRESSFDPKEHLAVVALGSSKLRKKVATNIMNDYGREVFVSLIDPSCILLSNKISIGIGAVVAPNCVLTCDVKIGDFAQLNVGTSIMHDDVIGDFFTTAPGVRINGKVHIGDTVYFGSNSCTREEIVICDDVIIGAGATVVRDITTDGTYVGVPAKKILQ